MERGRGIIDGKVDCGRQRLSVEYQVDVFRREKIPVRNDNTIHFT